MKAVKRYDPSRNVRLVTFAVHWIRAEIQEYIVKNWRLVKIASTKAQRKLFFNLRSMRKSLDTLQPTEINQIADQLNVKPNEVVEMEVRLGGHEISVDTYFEDDESNAPKVVLADDRLDPSMALEEKENSNREVRGLADALASLDDRSQRIIKARWLENNGKTLTELAEEFNVSAERIRQIEQTAMNKIKALMVCI
jgi:RNA polymerase sigma-32 factor